jgi:hypothetical protein
MDTLEPELAVGFSGLQEMTSGGTTMIVNVVEAEEDGSPLSVTVTVTTYVPGGGGGAIPDRVMVVPVLALGVSQGGRFWNVQLYGIVPPNAPH